MSFQERRATASLIATCLGSGFYFSDVFRRFLEQDGASGDLSFWAQAILIYIPVMIVFKVGILILFSIGNAIATREEERDITDEFDRLVDLKSTVIFYHLFMAILLGGVALIAAGYAAPTLFIVLLFGLLAGSAALDIAQIVLYRRGF